MRNISGQNGYNKKIKELLKFCGINRNIDDLKSGEPQQIPLCEAASSKAARKTYLTLQMEHQPDPYALGLHNRGSLSVYNYLSDSMAYKYMIVCRMFDENSEKLDFLQKGA